MTAVPFDPLPDPAPIRGLGMGDFTRLAAGGLGDGHNSFAHSMAWFKGKIYLGTTRSNLCMLRVQTAYENTPFHAWPVDCPETLDGLYKIDRRPQIWCYDPSTDVWEKLYTSPMIDGIDGKGKVAREIGYRSMLVFQGTQTEEPALYVATWAPGRAPGGLFLRCTDGRTFEPVTKYGVIDPPFSTTRSLTEWRGRMYFAPTAQRGQTGGQQNSALPMIFASDTPEGDTWEAVNTPGFGDEGNLGIFSLSVANDTLYAGTLNVEGLQIWATDGKGPAPYHWRKITDKGAGRGRLNQAVACMTEFKGALYVGTGIQGGGHDRVNDVGPAAAEVLRVNADDSVDVIVGDRDDYDREPMSGLTAGFGQIFNGYMWAMGTHDGWLYAGTYDWSINLRWARMEATPPKIRRFLEAVGVEDIIRAEGGADLWRTADGENWMPVTRRGFGNAYNWGIRNIVSTPGGLYVGTANVFGPRVAVKAGDAWVYEDNPIGGLEVWRGFMDNEDQPLPPSPVAAMPQLG